MIKYLRGFGYSVIGALLIAVGFFEFSENSAKADENETLWTALASGGHIAIMRHARAPGTGDPDNFALDDCRTQRNLDDTGREQARRTGEAFRGHGVEVARVLSSQWCRCMETAELLDLGSVTPLPALNSFFATPAKGTRQTEELKAFIRTLDASGPSIVMVTHYVNIARLTGETTASGEIVVLKLGEGGAFEVVGSIRAL